MFLCLIFVFICQDFIGVCTHMSVCTVCVLPWFNLKFFFRYLYLASVLPLTGKNVHHSLTLCTSFLTAARSSMKRRSMTAPALVKMFFPASKSGPLVAITRTINYCHVETTRAIIIHLVVTSKIIIIPLVAIIRTKRRIADGKYQNYHKSQSIAAVNTKARPG